MRTLGQFVFGILVAAGSVVMVLSAISLSLVEGTSVAALPPTLTILPTNTPAVETPAGRLTPAATELPAPTATHSMPTLCPKPAGWMPYTVETGDDLTSLARRAGLTTEQLQDANCLLSPVLLPGTILYLPPTPLATNTATVTLTSTVTPTVEIRPSATPCRPPRGWVLYTVQPKDNLFRLSQAFGVSVGQLQSANCMFGTLIQAGTRIYVPNVPTRTPEVTDTPAETPVSETSPAPSVTPSLTPTAEEITPTPEITVEPTFTFTPTAEITTPATEETPEEATKAAPEEAPVEVEDPPVLE